MFYYFNFNFLGGPPMIRQRIIGGATVQAVGPAPPCREAGTQPPHGGWPFPSLPQLDFKLSLLKNSD